MKKIKIKKNKKGKSKPRLRSKPNHSPAKPVNEMPELKGKEKQK